MIGKGPAVERARSGDDDVPPPIAAFRALFEDLHTAVSGELLGHAPLVGQALVCLLSEGHLLIEGYPGLGKTVLGKTLAQAMGGTEARIQFTPDLLPSDITGSQVWTPAKGGGLDFRPGPVFHNVVLADEINRAAPKTQSALLEVMEERQVTVEGRGMEVPDPFFVIATQNPLELSGTYRLPEAQIDRFAMKVTIDRPHPDAERQMVREDRRSVRRWRQPHGNGGRREAISEAVIDEVELRQMIEIAALDVHMSDAVTGHCVALAEATRRHESVARGVSPRATLALAAASRVLAAAKGQPFVTPTEVGDLVVPVFAHRLVLTIEARRDGATGESVVRDVAATVRSPDRRA